MTIDELREAMGAKHIVTLDYESYYARDYTLSDMTTVEYVLDERFLCQGVALTVDDGEPVWIPAHPHPDKRPYGQDAIRQALIDAGVGDEGVVTVGFNSQLFDDFITTQVYDLRPWMTIDVMALARIAFKADPAFNGFSLNRLAKYMGLGEKIGGTLASVKGQRELNLVQVMQMGTYAEQDVRLTRDMLLELLTNYIPWWADATLEHKIAHAHHLMFNRPLLHADVETLEEVREEEVDRRNSILEEAQLAAEKDDMDQQAFLSMLRSATYIKQCIVDAGELPPRERNKKTGKMKYAFNKQTPAFLALAARQDKLGAILRGRMVAMSNLALSRIDTLVRVSKATGGTLPVPLHYCGAKTGRSSGAMSINLQNLPRDGKIRSTIQAPPGWKLVVADSASIEARDVSAKAGAKNLLNVFTSGGDPYNWMASEIYERPINRKAGDYEEGALGKACIAEGSLVLTDRGLVPIQDITLDMRVWDGVEYVQHEGIIDQGVQEVITYEGLTATPDHEVYVKGARDPIPFGQAASAMDRIVRGARADGAPVRVGSYYRQAHRQTERVSLRPRPVRGQWGREVDITGQPVGRKDPVVLPKRSASILPPETVQATGRRQGPLHKPCAQAVRQLRRAWHNLRLPVSAGRRYVGTGAPWSSTGAGGTGPRRQQSWVRARQFTLGVTERTSRQPGQHSKGILARATNAARRLPFPIRVQHNQPLRKAGDDWGRNHCHGRTGGTRETQGVAAHTGKARVYDIVNCGPRRRFVANGALVANCVLGLGYGMQVPRFTLQCRIQGLEVEDDLIRHAHRTYHKLNPEIEELHRVWFSELVRAAVSKKPVPSTRGAVTFVPDGVILPSGRKLTYPGLKPVERYMGQTGLVYGKLDVPLMAHVLVENIIQASSRDIVMAQVLQHSMAKDHLTLLVHDEGVFCVPEPLAKDCLDELLYHMSRPPTGGWADDVPVGAEGGVIDYYQKL